MSSTCDLHTANRPKLPMILILGWSKWQQLYFSSRAMTLIMTVRTVNITPLLRWTNGPCDNRIKTFCPHTKFSSLWPNWGCLKGKYLYLIRPISSISLYVVCVHFMSDSIVLTMFERAECCVCNKRVKLMLSKRHSNLCLRCLTSPKGTYPAQLDV